MSKIIGLNPPVPPHVARMAEEAEKVSQQLLAIENFENSEPVFKALEAFDQHLLQAQSAAMQAYLRILLLRIERANLKPQGNPAAN